MSFSQPREPGNPEINATYWASNARKEIAIALWVLALIFLAGTIFSFMRVYAERTEEQKTDADVTKILKPSNVFDPYRHEFMFLGAAGIFLTGACSCFGVWGYINRQTPAQSRLFLLITGATIGGILTILAMGYLIWWIPELTNWLNKTGKSSPWKPLCSLLLFLIGAGLVFLSVQPAVRDQRDHVFTSRAIYSANLFLSVSLVLIALFAINIVINLKVPARLDTTDSGMTTISDQTRNYLAQLNQNLTIYSLISNESTAGRLLNRIQEANPQRIKIKQVSQNLDPEELATLKEKFKSSGILDSDGSVSLGILIVNDSAESRSSFIRESQFYDFKRDSRGQVTQRLFVAESRIAREILFLTESRTEPVVYFTQSSGELNIEDSTESKNVNATRKALQLRNAILGEGCKVKRWDVDIFANAMKVPDDASVIVVADPTTTLPKPMVEALKQYMSTPRPDGTRGKLIIMAGAHPGIADKKVINIGLEDYLESQGIQMPAKMMYSVPVKNMPAAFAGVGIYGSTIQMNRDVSFRATKIRPIVINNQRSRARKLGEQIDSRPNWLESEYDENGEIFIRGLQRANDNKNEQYMIERDIRKEGRMVAAIATDSDDKPQLAVFGFGDFFQDQNTDDPMHSLLISSTINWMRERPSLANQTDKLVGVYVANPQVSDWAGLKFPIAASMIVVTAAGFCLWALRRK